MDAYSQDLTMFSRLITPLVVLLLCTSVGAIDISVENFTLLDHKGKAHKLFYYSDTEAVVIIVQGNSCPMVRAAMPDYRQLRDQFADENVVFLMLNPVEYDNRASINKEAEEWDIDFPILDDESQIVGMGLGLTHTTEVLVIDPKIWKLTYRGPVNDRLEYERQKEEADSHYVADVLNSMLAGEDVEFQQIAPKGCLINYPDRSEDRSEISYSDHVAPLLVQKCGGCHTEGGIGPWSMQNYEIVKSFAPMMRQVLREHRMPPWHADPHVGEWKNDRSLKPEERQLLIRWVEAGAPRGSGPDPLAERMAQTDEWPLGPPDYVIEFPAFEVSATGIVEYQYFTIENQMEENQWVRALTVVPGDKRVVHHVLMGTVDESLGSPGGRIWHQFLGGYAPGSHAGGITLPPGSGVLVKKDSVFRAQVHYTPIGKESTDVTRVGLYFHDQPPQTIARNGVALNTILEIPPNTKEHAIRSYMPFNRDATLYSVLPHSHYRGKSSTFTLEYPDGRKELLLSVPSYDFNWQTSYQFSTPVAVPAGSKLHHETIYDNSKENPANPDPSRTVYWGQQSWEEMLYGSFVYTWDGETVDETVHDEAYMQTAQSFGFLDSDGDGLIQKDELTTRIGGRLRQGFGFVDTDKNDGIDIEELMKFSRR